MAEVEFRVVWQREDNRKKVKRFATKPGAERLFILLTSDEPWKVFGKEADDFVCCSGSVPTWCACGGKTMRQQSDEMRAELPALLFARIEEREVGTWRASLAGKGEQSDG